MRKEVLFILLVFQFSSYVCIFVHSTNGNNLKLRYSQCQLGRGFCKKNILNYSKSIFLNKNGVPKRAQISVDVNGYNAYLNASSNIDRFVQAKVFCDKYKIITPTCAPTIGQRIGDALYCGVPDFKYKFRFIRSSKYSYSIEFDLIRDILVNDFGWVECNESEDIYFSDENVWVFDAAINFLPRHIRSNCLDRMLSSNANPSNKLMLRNLLSNINEDGLMPAGFKFQQLLETYEQNRFSLISFLESQKLWVVKNPRLEGGKGVYIFKNNSKLADFILRASTMSSEAEITAVNRWDYFSDLIANVRIGIELKSRTDFVLEQYVFPPKLLDGRKFSQDHN